MKQKHSISSPSKPASHEKNRGDSFHNVKAGSGLLHNGLVSTEKLAFLAACCLFLSALDYLIPKPIPFMRIGLAHLPLLVSLPFLSLKPFLLLLGLKILVQGLIQGTLFSYVALFSVCGSITSGLVMFFIYKTAKKHISLIGVSMLGALINNLVQLLLAGLLLFKQAIWLIGPPFLILGSLSGFILGTFAQQFSQKSSWLSQFFAATKKRTEDQAPATVDKKQPVLPNPVQSHRPAGHTHTSCKLTLPSQMLLCGLLLIPAFLLHNHLILRLIQTGLFIGLALWAGKKIKYILSLCMGASLIIIHTLTPSGEVLFTLGSFPITAGALQWGLIKTTTLLGLIYLSQFAIHPGLQLPGVLGGIIGKTFFYFERIQEEYRHKPLYRRNQKATEKVKGEKRHGIRHISRYFKYDKLIQRLDEVLLLAFSDSEKSKDQQSGPSLKNKSIHGQSRFFLPTLYGLVILNWLAFISILLK